MAENRREPDWDWVSATQNCSALVMFGALKQLAKRDVDVRNSKQHKKFQIEEVDGVTFAVSRVNDWDSRVFFQVDRDMSIVVSGLNRANEVRYTVALDDDGVCRYRRGNDMIDHWQVLKAALETLLFT